MSAVKILSQRSFTIDLSKVEKDKVDAAHWRLMKELYSDSTVIDAGYAIREVEARMSSSPFPENEGT